MRVLPGMTWSSLKRMPELGPVWIVIGTGTALSTLYLLRLALFNPDVTYNRIKNPEPYQVYKDKKYKFVDYAYDRTPKSPAPEY